MRVLKFGGTSVGSPAAIGKIIEILKDSGHRDTAAVVVSAFSGVTDGLIGIAGEAVSGDWQNRVKDLRKRHLDMLEYFVKADELETAARLDELIRELSRILDGVAMLGELSP
ncbi:MAG: bifunctional aspartate kinase/homoserine dehydrogenase I, partial [Treponema sp.]|nr:bifunctional aspartate kinase/homoserine dehydrogenase I [Treponema sp.]